jgi:hypothetical protein
VPSARMWPGDFISLLGTLRRSALQRRQNFTSGCGPGRFAMRRILSLASLPRIPKGPNVVRNSCGGLPNVLWWATVQGPHTADLQAKHQQHARLLGGGSEQQQSVQALTTSSRFEGPRLLWPAVFSECRRTESSGLLVHWGDRRGSEESSKAIALARPPRESLGRFRTPSSEQARTMPWPACHPRKTQSQTCKAAKGHPP